MAERGPERLRILLHVTPTARGGRKTAVFTGYRAAFWWGELDEHGVRCYHDAPLTLEGTARLAPGETAVATIQPLMPAYWQDVSVGANLEMCEGARVVGVAEVLEIS